MTKTDVKVKVTSEGGEELTWPRGKPLPSFADRADELGDSLNEIAERLRGRLHELERQPRDEWDLDQVSLTFSLDLQADAGVIVARASTKAGFQATLTWKRSARTAPQ